MKYIVLYNPYSFNGKGKEEAYKLLDKLKDELEFVSMHEIDNFEEFFKNNKEDIIICGGDGTLNYFINHTKDIEYKNNILYYSTGTGNDFYHEVGDNNHFPMNINKYLEDLPTVIVNDKEYQFLNGVGYGIDGYCCEEGDRIKEKTKKPVNYTSIAIKGLLYKFKPRNARIIVDGECYEFKKVWLAPTMNGKFYGGGMMAAPNQDRLNKDRTVTLVVMHGKGKIATLLAFPSIFKGEHINKKKMVSVFEGYNITVSFDRPTALQIDGETIKNVTEYSVKVHTSK